MIGLVFLTCLGIAALATALYIMFRRRSTAGPLTWSARLTLCFAAAFSMVTLLPFTIVGDGWQAVWAAITLPFSNYLNGSGPVGHVFGASLVATGVWSAVLFVVLKFFPKAAERPEPRTTQGGTRPPGA